MRGPIELIRVVGQPAYAAGLAYAQQGRVLLHSHDPEDQRVDSVVRGSGRNTYHCRVRYQRTSSGVFSDFAGSCSCPVRLDCKHCVATLIDAFALTSVTDPALAQTSADESWRNLLGGILRQGRHREPPGGWQPIALALSFQAPQAPDTQPTRRREIDSRPWSRTMDRILAARGSLDARPLRSGKRQPWVTTGATWSKVSSGYVDDVDPEQVRSLSQLLDLYNSTQSYNYGTPTSISLARLDSPAVWPILHQIVDSGVQLITDSTWQPVRLDDTPAVAQIAISKLTGGQLQVRAELSHPQLTNQSAVVQLGSVHGIAWFDGQQLRLCPLTKTATPQWIQLRRESSGITIPASQIAEFEQELLPDLRRVGWTSPDASYQPAPPAPPQLQLTIDLSAPSAEYSLPKAKLRWGWRYAHSRDPLPLTPTTIDLNRDRTAEAQICVQVTAALADLPALLTSDLLGAQLLPEAELSGMAVVRLVEDICPRLEQLGVLISAGTLPTFRPAPAPQVSVGIRAEGTDWFDLEITMSVGAVEVPIASLITALTVGDDTLFLPDGSYLSLDDPELDRLRELLAEARGLTDQRRDGLRVPRIRQSWWEELLSLGIVQTATNAWFDAVRYAMANPPEPAALPQGLDAQLRPYQQTGFEWLANLRRSGLGGVLADDMGLGKTLQSLAMIADEREHREPDAPNAPWLVVAPTSVVPNWATEARRFVPDLKVGLVTATEAKRGFALAELADEVDVLVTSYTLLRLEANAYNELNLAGVLLDEAQQAKNHNSKTFAAVTKLGAPMVFAITGTPMENNLEELWAIFHLTAPGLLGSPAQFTKSFRRPIERGTDTRGQLMSQLRRRVAPFLLRRTKDHVATDLPAKQEQVVSIDLAPAHRRIYDRHLQRERQRVLRLADDLDHNRVEVLSALTRLRQLAIDVSLVEPKASAPSSKLDALLPLLAQAAAEGHRVLVFSQFTRYLQLIATRLTAEKISYSYLDGSTTKRAEVIDRFATGADPVFLISLKAGGVGLNLTMADYAILADPWWNPATEAQAIDRTHRIGQTRPVHVYRLVARDTIEEKVLALQESKRALVAEVLAAADTEAGESAAPVTGGAKLSAEDLRLLLA